MSLLGGLTQALFGSPANPGGEYLNTALQNYANLTPPELEELALQQQQLQGTIDPRLEEAINLGASAMENVSTDPRLRQAQMQALEQYTQQAEGKMNAADQAAFELARQSAAGEQQARQGAILQEMQQRGQGGSGAELLAKLTANQSGAQMLQNAQLEQAKAMQQARMQALAQQAQLGGQMRQQEFGEQSDIAQAKDLIARTNAANAQAVGARNVASQNQAQAANIANKQNVANTNVGIANTQQQYNKQLPQQKFQNQLSIAAGKSGINTQQAANATQQQANQGAMMGGLLQAGIGAAMMSDKETKTEIKKEKTLQDFLDSITAYNYNYKNPIFGEGQQTSVMAQDLEKTPEGKAMIVETPEGKAVDYGKGLGVMMASLSQLNDRLNKLEGK